MGFLKAVYDLERIETDDGYSPDWADIDSFLSLPLPYFSANDRSYEEKNGRVIRVWLKVRNPFAKTLEISGVEKIDLVDFLAGDGSMQEKKRKYLYKDKTGSNTPWSFSPLYKLGQPKFMTFLTGMETSSSETILLELARFMTFLTGMETRNR